MAPLFFRKERGHFASHLQGGRRRDKTGRHECRPDVHASDRLGRSDRLGLGNELRSTATDAVNVHRPSADDEEQTGGLGKLPALDTLLNLHDVLQFPGLSWPIGIYIIV